MFVDVRDKAGDAAWRERRNRCSCRGQRLRYASPDEIQKLCLHPCSVGWISGKRYGLGADVVTEPGFDGVSGIELKDRLHLVGCEAINVNDFIPSQIGKPVPQSSDIPSFRAFHADLGGRD